LPTMETAEEIVTIMECCSAAYQKRKDVKPSDAILIMLTDRCHRQLISNEIKKGYEQGSTAPPKQTGKPATDKQISFIIDLGGDPDWTGTSFEASKEIERLKSK